MRCEVHRVVLLSVWVHLFQQRPVRLDNFLIPRAARFGSRHSFKGCLHRAALERETLRRQLLG